MLVASLVLVALGVLVVAVAFVLSLAVDVHGVICTLGKSILSLSIVGDDGTEDGALEVLRDASNDDAVGTRRLAVIDAVLHDWEFQIWLMGVTEGEVLVVVVSVRVCDEWSVGRSNECWTALGICVHLSLPGMVLASSRRLVAQGLHRHTQSLLLAGKLESFGTCGIDGLLAVGSSIAVAATWLKSNLDTRHPDWRVRKRS